MAYDSTQAKLNDVRQRIKLAKDKLDELLTGGQSFSISGGVTVTQPKIDELQTLLNSLYREEYILSKLVDGQSATPLSMRTAPDFS